MEYPEDQKQRKVLLSFGFKVKSVTFAVLKIPDHYW